MEKGNFCNLLLIAQTDYDYVAGPAALLLLASDCCLFSVTPSMERTEFTTGVNDTLCNINFLLQFSLHLLLLLSSSLLHTDLAWLISSYNSTFGSMDYP